MNREDEWIKLRECMNCGGDVLAKRFDGKVQDQPSVELKEYHNRDCISLPVYTNFHHEEH